MMRWQQTIGLSLLLLLLTVSPLMADGVLTERTYKRLVSIHELIGNNQYAKAVERLNSLLPSTKRKPYEHATVLQTFGYAYAGMERYRDAVKKFEEAVALNALPEGVQTNLQYNLSQMSAAIPDYQRARKYLEIWLQNVENPGAPALAYAATVYAQLKQFGKAIPFIKKAIKKSAKPPESWYQLLVAMHYSRKEYSAAAGVLETMIVLYPDKKDYWDQLSGVYFTLKKDRKSLAVNELAYKKGHLATDKELMNLVNLYLHVDIPHSAAKLLEKEINASRIPRTQKNLEKLGDAWLLAKEYDKAAKAMQQAAASGGGGKLYMKAAQVYVEQDDWKKTLSSVTQAIKAGGLKDTGTAYLIKGMAHYELKQRKGAMAAFRSAQKHKKSSGQASDWINYINTEIQAEQAEKELKEAVDVQLSENDKEGS